jgi:hypothetical protein
MLAFRCNLRDAIGAPWLRAIERRRRHIGSEKRDLVEAHTMGGGNRLLEARDIAALQDRTRDQPRRRILAMQRHYATRDAIEAAPYPANSIVRVAIAIERDHHGIDRRRNVRGVVLDQQPRRHQRDANPQRLQFAAERPQIAMQQRFAAGQHDALHPELANRAEVAIEILIRDVAFVGVCFPDVTHHAAAVAGAVDAQRKNRQAFEPMADSAAGPSRDLAWSDH